MAEKKGGFTAFQQRPFPTPTSTFCSANSSGRGAFIVSTAAKISMPIFSPFFFFLFGCENNSGYQTASGFGPWNAFVLQKAKKLPRITKRQVRTIAFRKQPYYSVLSGLWRRQKGRRGIIESVALNTARLCMTHLTAIFNTFV